MIFRSERPDEGHVLVNNRNLTELKENAVPYLRRSMGIIFQDFRLLPRKTVFDNVAVTLKVVGLSEGLLRRKVFEALRLVGLDDVPKVLPSVLSAGEQQRVCLARAIVNDPLILLADEPTSNLDAVLSAEILALLKEVNLRGTTVVVATHNPNLVGRLNRRMIVLQHGRVMDSKAAQA
jgi:cell division transport system ATP-binding protein